MGISRGREREEYIRHVFHSISKEKFKKGWRKRIAKNYSPSFLRPNTKETHLEGTSKRHFKYRVDKNAISSTE